MTESTPAGFTREPPPAYIRYPLAMLVYGVVSPSIRLIEKLGFGMRLFEKMAQRRERQFADTSAFDGYFPAEHDVFVATFSKSGTNWMMQMAHQIAFLGEGEFNHIHDVVPWPEFQLPSRAIDLHDDSVWQASPTNLRVIKTHLPFDEIPYDEQSRYITVIRDPKDVFVSSYYFAQSLGMSPIFPSVNTLVELFMSPHFPLGGSWVDHIVSFWKQRHQENVMILSFKAMKQDLSGTVRQVAEFMGVELTEIAFDKVVEKSSFQYMKQHSQHFNPGSIAPWSTATGTMIRRGQQGASSELLTLDQQRQLDSYCQGRFAELVPDFPYAEFCDLA